ncbi:hypothetical protein WJX77_006576 [Trebouxia sp. C0004]
MCCAFVRPHPKGTTSSTEPWYEALYSLCDIPHLPYSLGSQHGQLLQMTAFLPQPNIEWIDAFIPSLKSQGRRQEANASISLQKRGLVAFFKDVMLPRDKRCKVAVHVTGAKEAKPPQEANAAVTTTSGDIAAAQTADADSNDSNDSRRAVKIRCTTDMNDVLPLLPQQVDEEASHRSRTSQSTNQSYGQTGVAATVNNGDANMKSVMHVNM